MLVQISASERGESHKRKGKPLQDAVFATTNKQKTVCYAFVADGHGGDKYFRSAIGSKMAVELANDCVNDVFQGIMRDIWKEDKTIIEQNIKHICKRIWILWREKVYEHFATNPLADAEKEICTNEKIDTNDCEVVPLLYGTTLIAAVYLQKLNFWFAFQIGDGKCIVIDNDGNAFEPIPNDERLKFGRTTSLCGKDAINDFRFNYGFEKVNGMAVVTDGISDSFKNDAGLHKFILNIYTDAIQNISETQKELSDFLPELSKNGSGDDVSIAAFFDTDVKKDLKQQAAGTIGYELQQFGEFISARTYIAQQNVDTFIASMSESVKKKSETLFASKRRVFVFALCIGLVAGIIIGVLAYKYLLRKHTELELQSAIEQIEIDVTKIQDVHILENNGTISEDDVAADDAIDNTVNEIEIGSEILDIGENEAVPTDNEILPVVTDESHAVDNSETENVQ